jgi:hypothetical protein
LIILDIDAVCIIREMDAAPLKVKARRPEQRFQILVIGTLSESIEIGSEKVKKNLLVHCSNLSFPV